MSHVADSRRSAARCSPAAAAWVAACLGLLIAAGCTGETPVDPFAAAPVPIDGLPRTLRTDIVNVGQLAAGQVIRIEAQGDGIDSVLVLRQDEVSPASGVIVGGGRPGSAFDYRIASDGVYGIFIQFDPNVPAAVRSGSLAVGFGDPAFRPPGEQFVQVVFAPGYLSEPGLFDPEAMTDADHQLLVDLSPTVQESILAELHRVFDGTPVRILSETEPLPAGPISRLTYRPDRVLAEDQTTIDSAQPPPDPSRPQCQVRVTFGEVLPDGREQDTGNTVRDDEAAVYVGSFQGRGADCHTAVINSVNNLVFALAQTGAHEIGHLVGLYHVEQIDIMNRTATLAFLRELALSRGQIQIDKVSGQQIITEVVTNIIQDPELYFRSAFDFTPP